MHYYQTFDFVIFSTEGVIWLAETRSDDFTWYVNRLSSLSVDIRHKQITSKIVSLGNRILNHGLRSRCFSRLSKTE